MRIAVSQIDTKAGDLAHTAQRMADISVVARERGVDLLTFGMCTLTGPIPVDYSSQDAFLFDLVQVLTDLAKRVACDCLVPVVIPMGEAAEIEVMHLHGGMAHPLRFSSLMGRQRQTFSASAPSLSEELVRFEVAGTSVGLALSYEDLDRWNDAEEHVDVILYVASYSYAIDDMSSALGAALGENRYVQDARETGSWLVGAGSLGGYGTQVFSGGSFVLAPDGRLAAASPSYEEDLLVADVGAETVLEAGAEMQEEVYDERYGLWQALVLGIRDYVQKLGLSDVAFALDGSLASMLLSVLATDALGPTHVHALLCVPDGSARVADSARLARTLRLDLRPLPGLPEHDLALAHDMAQVQLAALARETGALPLACDDKTGLALEARAGQVHAGRLAPLGDVYRIDVLDVARLRNTISAVLPALEIGPSDVPDVGIDIPSWGCEQLLERMDSVLAAHVEGEQSLSEVIEAAGDEQLVEEVLGALREREAHRIAFPPCLMMTTRTLRDSRMPLGFAWRDHARGELPETIQRTFESFLRSDAHQPKMAERLRLATPEEAAAHRGEFMEALELLRDLALGGGGEWPDPFSEN